jgi:TPP-dependent pyruvate/acetoin dehydrogenase alpha subunit
MEKKIREDCDEALAKAKESPWPEEADLYTDISSDKSYYVRAVELNQSRIVDNAK